MMVIEKVGSDVFLWVLTYFPLVWNSNYEFDGCCV